MFNIFVLLLPVDQYSYRYILSRCLYDKKSLVDDVIPDVQSTMEFEASCDGGQTGKKENWFAHVTGMMQNIKLTVIGMVNNVSNYFQDIFGFSESDDMSSDSNGNTRNMARAKAIIGLVVLVMMVVVLKRA